jgi:hypothetical protein
MGRIENRLRRLKASMSPPDGDAEILLLRSRGLLLLRRRSLRR